MEQFDIARTGNEIDDQILLLEYLLVTASPDKVDRTGRAEAGEISCKENAPCSQTVLLRYTGAGDKAS